MNASIDRMDFPEIVLGFVSPIGADLMPVISAFRQWFAARDYRVEEIRVTGVFQGLAKHIPPKIPLRDSPSRERFATHIAYGNQVRHDFGDDSILAALTIKRLVRRRLAGPSSAKGFTRTVYLLHQFKREEEIELLRAVYGPSFFQISVYSRRGARVDYLSRAFANSANSALARDYRAPAEALIRQDEDERETPHGQQVGRIFHDADLIISLDNPHQTAAAQAERFCGLLFGDNRISPARAEFGMFMAKGAALRTLDLSRQVGAALFTRDGDIIALGCNEVPKGGGGLYWDGDGYDDREVRRGHDSNDRRKREILTELAAAMGFKESMDSLLRDRKIRDSQFMDALEYGRIVHAEMAAITDAARLGRATLGSTLYCTTFPCHMCAKHIVAAGVAHVVFLEPYPKSLASELHSDSLQVEGSDRGHYQHYPAVQFEHFHGVTPRRYRELFERRKRKNGDGLVESYSGGTSKPIIEIRLPFYSQLELAILGRLRELPEHIFSDAPDATAPGTD